ncbi:TIGR03790 family protein [Akkermansiaceae bacterium]|nr:TIGR03790 family protein [Akkermansiaceae bacterium]
MPTAAFGKLPLLLPLVAAAMVAGSNAQQLTSREVLVVYNKSDPESARLAEVYQEARGIPASQVLGLEMPPKPDISRAEYDESILTPLRDHFTDRGWWKRSRDPQGLLVPTENRIRAIVLMRGVPLRIQPAPKAAPKEGEAPPADPIAPRDEACVDSELALFGIEDLPSKGVLKNAFYQSDSPLSKAKLPYFVLTSRIDSPAYAICKKMITDAVATEKHGLWGRAYVDIANKFPQGDKWLSDIVAENMRMGIPTVTDRFNDTLPKNYPLTDASIYYGWYDWDVSGPFLDPGFMFRPGAVAVHLHSFSAQQLTDAHKNWSAPLLVRGAAATVGNVYEPYLDLTHHFEILHDRLLKGWTFAEAAWASIPVASWQGVVLGDPLYRPFLHIDGTGTNRPEDRDFRALRAASRQWPDESALRREKISGAAEKLKSGILAEGLALGYLEERDIDKARLWLGKAKEFHERPEDKLRQDIQLIAIEREMKNNPAAIKMLREAKERYGSIPAADALSGWLDILDPPPPPPADPTKIPKQ